MEPYKNLNGDSGVTHYEIGPDFIRVRFRGDEVYVYDHHTPGAAHVAQMKVLAVGGQGLATYIARHVRTAYARKGR